VWGAIILSPKPKYEIHENVARVNINRVLFYGLFPKKDDMQLSSMSPIEILKIRFAKGERNKEEYESMKKTIEQG
jgi:uncharacterized membrane protein